MRRWVSNAQEDYPFLSIQANHLFFNTRRRARSSPHNLDASRLSLPPRLGHRLQLPRIHRCLACLYNHAARLEHH